jgi:hypothetical protein
MSYAPQHWLKRLALFLVLALLLALLSLASAQESVIVQLASRGGSSVTGTAVLTAEGEATNVTLEVSGLPANATARATMNAGTCEMPSASFAALPDLVADANGKAMATGKVLFRGAEGVALATMADGEHVISIQVDQDVACGVIPMSASVAATTAGMPQTGGLAPWFVALVVAVVLGLITLFATFFARHHNRPSLRS